MVHFIKEAFQIYINNMLITWIYVLLCFQYRLLGVAIGSKTVAVILKLHLKFDGDYLSYRLLQ